METDVLEPARSDGGGEFLVACQGQLWQLELLGSFWATDQLLGTIKAMGQPLAQSQSGHRLDTSF